MFPEFSQELQGDIQVEQPNGKKSFLFDFDKGDFTLKDGKIIETEGIESIKVWIEKILKTEKFKFKVYETADLNEYGVTIMDLVGSDYPLFFIQAEIQREVTEALLRNNSINDVTDFSFSRDRRTIMVSFTVKTIYGSFSKGVIF